MVFAGGGDQACNALFPAVSGKANEYTANCGAAASSCPNGFERATDTAREKLRVNPISFPYHAGSFATKARMTRQTESLDAALRGHAAARAARVWVPVRNLGPQHGPRIGEHLLALNERDRRLRFGMLATDPQILAYVGQIDFERDLVFGIFDRHLRLRAMAHLAFEPAGDRPATVVEFGVSVSERARGRGYGGRLFEHAVTHARNRGAQTMMIHIERDNAPMLGIVRRADAEVEFDGSEAVARLLLPPDTLGSQIEELVGHQAAEMDYRIKMQVLKLDRLRPRCLREPGNGR